MTTLILYDLTKDNQRKLAVSIIYFGALGFMLGKFTNIRELKWFALIGNTLSATIGPLGVLSNLVKNESTSKINLNMTVLLSAFLKSCIWLFYGILKHAFPIIVSHVLGIIILFNTILYAKIKQNNMETHTFFKKLIIFPVFVANFYNSLR